eukprot:TRINITY_DN2236_c0_g1_i4.p1 TRINITY_DN2236_c0_g1~~TRINITY_DN2236_c0_g1_i4.p1  ORF type:complete len:509 (-),score=137.76 TRINITY_DN2236_c0_g1_i4:70-1596(-)
MDSRRRKPPFPLQSSKSVPGDLRVETPQQAESEPSLSSSSSRKYATFKPSTQQLYGLDAELKAKMEAKWDPEEEVKAIEWIETLTGELLEGDFHSGLKDGVLLCKTLNSIRPGIVKRFAPKPNHPLVERENIQAYLNGCIALGLPSQELFIISDLHEAKDLSAVLRNIYSLGRQAQVIPGFEGPRLGVKYSVSLEEQRERQEKKKREREEMNRRMMEIDDQRKQRRDELEIEKKHEAIEDLKHQERRKLSRQVSKGRMSLDEYKEKESQLHQKIETMKQNIEEVDIEVGPILYGMDLETHKKLKKKHNSQKAQEDEEEALDWVEAMTGDKCDDIYESLKSGVTLCRLINAIRPNAIAKIDTRNSLRFGPAVSRENIKIYLDRCVMLGIPKSELFNISDLYDKKDLAAVVRNILALKRAFGKRIERVEEKKPVVELKKPEEKKSEHIITMPPVIEVPPIVHPTKFWTWKRIVASGVVASIVGGGLFVALSDSEAAQNIRNSLFGGFFAH